MAVQNQDKTFENFESNFFCFESVLFNHNTDPDKNVFNNKLQQTDSPPSRKFYSNIQTIK